MLTAEVDIGGTSFEVTKIGGVRGLDLLFMLDLIDLNVGGLLLATICTLFRLE
jgi:hypothetical protein